MSDVRKTVEQVTLAGINATDTGSLSTSDTYLVNNDGNVILHFKKSEAVDATITFDTPGTVRGLAIANPTVTVPASTGDIMVGPFPVDTFNDSNGDVRFTASNIAGLTVAAVRI